MAGAPASSIPRSAASRFVASYLSHSGLKLMICAWNSADDASAPSAALPLYFSSRLEASAI